MAASTTTVSAELIKDATNLVSLKCLRDTTDGSTVTTATVTVVINDAGGTPLAGVAWPVSMPHISRGTYRGTIPAAMVVVVGDIVDVVVNADDGVERDRDFHQSVTITEG